LAALFTRTARFAALSGWLAALVALVAIEQAGFSLALTNNCKSGDQHHQGGGQCNNSVHLNLPLKQQKNGPVKKVSLNRLTNYSI